jgi:hypothetical protein
VLLLGLLTGGAAGRAPRVLWDRVRAGVGAKTGACLRMGDSGRGRDGRLALKVGLLDRTGPTDCENFKGTPGIGGVVLVSPLRCEGVPGVAGKESRESEGDSRRSARCTGRKIPAPGTEVVK